MLPAAACTTKQESEGHIDMTHVRCFDVALKQEYTVSAVSHAVLEGFGPHIGAMTMHLSPLCCRRSIMRLC